MVSEQVRQTEQYKHRRWIEAGNFGFMKLKNCTIHVAKTKALISFAVTAKLICTFVFAFAKCFFRDTTHLSKSTPANIVTEISKRQIHADIRIFNQKLLFFFFQSFERLHLFRNFTV